MWPNLNQPLPCEMIVYKPKNGSNDSGLKFVWPPGAESIAGQTHRIWVSYI